MRSEHVLQPPPPNSDLLRIPSRRSEPRSEEHTSELQSRRDLVCRHLHSFPTRRSSDLLADAFLYALDEVMTAAAPSRYLRYVDDVRIFASEEMELDALGARFATAATELGLVANSIKTKRTEIGRAHV